MGEKVKLQLKSQTTILDNLSSEEKKVVELNNGEKLQYVILAIGDFNKEITFEINSKNTELEIIGICLLNNNEKVNLKTIQHHKNRDSISTNLIKTVLKGSSNFNFEGLIKIDKVADQTNAFLTQNTLNLSENSINHSVPSLEINASDVKASHAATTSFIDEKSLFYLTSRGVNQKEAENMIIKGFINSVVEKILDKKMKLEVEKSVKSYFNS